MDWQRGESNEPGVNLKLYKFICEIKITYYWTCCESNNTSMNGEVSNFDRPLVATIASTSQSWGLDRHSYGIY